MNEPAKGVGPKVRTINAAGLDIIKRNEGLRLVAYQDVAGIWTVGYGHTPASPGEVIDDAEAEMLLLNDLNFASAVVSDATVGVPTTDNQFAALVSLTFNIGIGGFRQSTVLRRHLAGESRAADAFLMWNKAHVDGQLVEVAGLTRRRDEERALYLLGATEEHPADVIEQILAAPRFQDGVQAYQRSRGLTPDAYIGPLTLAKIGEDMRRPR